MSDENTVQIMDAAREVFARSALTAVQQVMHLLKPAGAVAISFSEHGQLCNCHLFSPGTDDVPVSGYGDGRTIVEAYETALAQWHADVLAKAATE